jgi:hypothetical protein
VKDYKQLFGNLVDGEFPDIKARNASGPGMKDGSPYTAAVLDDLWGFLQAVLAEAQLKPNGESEASGASQVLEGLIATIKSKIATELQPGTVRSSILGGNIAVDPETGIMSVNGWNSLAERLEALEIVASEGGFNPPSQQPPLVDAGNNRTITLPTNSVTLTGVALTPVGYIGSVLWTRVSGPGNVTIVNPNSASTNVTGLAIGTHVFRLTVTDSTSRTATADVTITVNPEPTGSQAFTNNGTFTVPANVTRIRISAAGGGGGGGTSTGHGSAGGAGYVLIEWG